VNVDELLTILTELHPDVDFTSHTQLIDGKVLDSYDIITLVAEVSERLDVQIPAEEIVPENFNSYPSLLALVTRLSDN
jgi:acyl carrier protein